MKWKIKNYQRGAKRNNPDKPLVILMKNNRKDKQYSEQQRGYNYKSQENISKNFDSKFETQVKWMIFWKIINY